MHAAEAHAKRWGIRLLALHVHEENEQALALYRKCGFRTVAKDDPFRAFMRGKTQVLMTKAV